MSTETQDCRECGLPLAAHNTGACPDALPAGSTAQECADCGELFAESAAARECREGEGFEFCCEFCSEERLRAEEAAICAADAARAGGAA